KNQSLQGKNIAEVAQEQGKHPVDAMLDLAVEEDLKTEFAMPSFANDNEEAVGQIIKHPLCLIGASDGGAHTKFLTTGRYPTHFLAHWCATSRSCRWKKPTGGSPPCWAGPSASATAVGCARGCRLTSSS